MDVRVRADRNHLCFIIWKVLNTSWNLRCCASAVALALPLPLPLQAPSTIEYNFPYLLFSIKMLDHLMCVRNPIDFNFRSNKDRKTSSFCGNVADRTIYTITTWRTILRKKKIAASSIPSAVAIHTNRLNSLHFCWDWSKVFRLLATMSKSTLDFHATASWIL